MRKNIRVYLEISSHILQKKSSITIENTHEI